MSTVLPTPYQQFIHKSRYARWIEGEKRRETWEETVDRYVDHMCDEQCEGKIPDDVRAEIRESILSLRVMPSMRCMMTAGEALSRDQVAGYNCSYLAIDDPKAFDEILYILMCGTGVGFSVERQFIAKLPAVAERLRPSKTVIGVEDSKLGWANAYRELVSMLYQGRVPKWDVTEVRAAGSRLKTFGGRASGPEPLEELFRFTIEMFKGAEGRRLNSIECHDLCCKIGDVVVVGGVRRSALISLSNPSDDRMRHAKDGNWGEVTPWRKLANNSACYTEKPGMEVFFREWLALYESKSGERGIFNREAVKEWAEKYGRRDPNHEFGCNPSLRAGTRVWTSDGVVPIQELQDKEFTVRNLDGRLSRAKCWLSGKSKPLYRVTIKGGHEYYATAEHEWPVITANGVKKVQTKDLKAGVHLPLLSEGVDVLTGGQWGDEELGFLMGWNIGDGWLTKRSDNGKTQLGFIVSDEDRLSAIDERIEAVLKSLGSESSFGPSGEMNVIAGSVTSLFEEAGYEGKHKGLPSSVWTRASEVFRRGLVDGLFSSDGCFDDGVSMSTAHGVLARDVADLLGFYGIKTTVNKAARSDIEFPNGKTYDREYELWYVKVRHHASIVRFHNLFGISHVGKQTALNRHASRQVRPIYNGKVRVSSVELTSLKEDVWDISVADETHCFQLAHCVTGNCSEIVLRSCGFCNLSEVVVRAEDTLDDIRAKVRVAVIIGTMQASLTNFRYLRDIWRKNAEEEALLGVSLTGIMDNELMAGRKAKKELVAALDGLREYAVEVNAEWAERLGINPAASITCVKPSGTVSQLVDCASGIHPRYSRYYVRRVKADKKDPLARLMMELGFPAEDAHDKPEHNIVFSFPVKVAQGAVTTTDISSIEHLELWKVYQLHWCEHKPSITVHLREHEWMEAGAWVYRNFDIVSGIAFLPYSGHHYQQAPYEELDEAGYQKLLAKMPADIDWARLSEFEKEDQTVGMKSYACTKEACERVDLTSEDK